MEEFSWICHICLWSILATYIFYFNNNNDLEERHRINYCIGNIFWNCVGILAHFWNLVMFPVVVCYIKHNALTNCCWNYFTHPPQFCLASFPSLSWNVEMPGFFCKQLINSVIKTTRLFWVKKINNCESDKKQPIDNRENMVDPDTVFNACIRGGMQ